MRNGNKTFFPLPFMHIKLSESENAFICIFRVDLHNHVSFRIKTMEEKDYIFYSLFQHFHKLHTVDLYFQIQFFLLLWNALASCLLIFIFVTSLKEP